MAQMQKQIRLGFFDRCQIVTRQPVGQVEPEHGWGPVATAQQRAAVLNSQGIVCRRVNPSIDRRPEPEQNRRTIRSRGQLRILIQHHKAKVDRFGAIQLPEEVADPFRRLAGVQYYSQPQEPPRR